ncbi:MAG: hypothetical protein H7210_11640 [Pyrinomonadaceae bacterium]|nr:hypothetical protein [Phycisphaerales bacterium]
MAGRTSVGIGWGVAFSIISVIALGLFVTTVVFYAQKQAATKKFNELQTGVNEFVKEGERERDDIKQLRNSATKKSQSLVAYLIANQEQTMTLAGGSPRTSIEDFQKSADQLTGGRTANLLQAIRDRDAQLGLERKRATEADAARQAAQVNLDAEVARVKSLEESQKEALAAQRSQIDIYKGEVDKNADEVRKSKEEMSQHEEKVRADAADTIAQLNARISELERDQLLGRETINRLQADLKGRSLKPGDEYALVDAEVIGLDAAENNVFLNIGSNKKARVGLTFEVYTEVTALRPDEATGNYPAGKASLEIIKVDATSSTARVIREKKGNPILKGDVVANAVYDPNKVYTLLVFGNFDANQDGFATAQEASDVKALISEWGGKTIDELAGNVDFLVLGQRPTLPLPPPPGAPVAVIEEYVRVKRLSDRYDDLFKQASATSIPVLNENRLYTLIGKRLGR